MESKTKVQTNSAGRGRTVRRPTRRLAAAVVVVWLSTLSFDVAAQDQTTTTEAPSSESEASTTITLPAAPSAKRATKSQAAANLGLARAADVEIARSLEAINKQTNETIAKIDGAEQTLKVAEQTQARTQAALEAVNQRQSEIEASLLTQAVTGFQSQRTDQAGVLFTQSNLGSAVRQEQMLSQANTKTGDLLEELRVLNEDRRLANAEATMAKEEAENAEEILTAELKVLEAQKAEQLKLKAEAERRIDQWASQLNAYAQADAAVQSVIAGSSSSSAGSVGPSSRSGFQWPVKGRATSEFGYRIHPIYGSRRLHAGLDIGAPNGTAIWAAADGVVIFSGTQGGYGRTIIIDHGGGITTLYAHQSTLLASKGQRVSRGTTIGKVGSTGSSTGNHLHFEVRVGGTPKNPRNYLP